MRDLFLGRAELPQRRRRYEADQKTEDREYDKQLQQCEAAFPAAVSIILPFGSYAARRGCFAPMPNAVPLQMIGVFKTGVLFYADARRLHSYFLQWQLTDCSRGPASSSAGKFRLRCSPRRALFRRQPQFRVNEHSDAADYGGGGAEQPSTANPSKDERPKKPGQPDREAEKGAKRQRRQGPQSGPGEAERGGRCERRHGGEQDDLRQRRKTEPRARRREQLGIALAETLTAAVTL